MSAVPDVPRQTAPAPGGRLEAIAQRWRYPLAVYLVSRVVYLLVAIADIFIRNEPLGRELRNWDGVWYVRLAEYGYSHHIPTVYGKHGYSTLGFEPLYSMLMWLGGEIIPRGVEPAGLLVSLVGGAICTVEVSVLAERWWGRDASRRGVLFFCFFPGTIVFSMVYSEGMALPLIAGALICFEDRRWISAGLLAGAATAVEPVVFAIIPALGIPAAIAIWRTRGRSAEAWRMAWAPVLSVWGAVGVGIFMWFWTGTPMAVFQTQRVAWGEHSSLLAVYDQMPHFIHEFTHWRGLHHVNLNLPVGFIGAAFMLWGLWWLWKLRRGLLVPLPASRASSVVDAAAGRDGSSAAVGTGVSLAALIYTFFVFVETFTSDNTPPNPRMLLCAFPLLLAFAAPRPGKQQKWLMGVTLVLLVAMSIGTFAGGGLRP